MERNCPLCEMHASRIWLENDEILLEPLFWCDTPNGKFICFGTQQPSRDTRHQAEDLGFRILTPGEALE